MTVVRRLYRLGYDHSQITQLFRFIDWVMRLPDDLERRFRAELRAYEEENHMPYVTSMERIGREEGRQEGLVEGRQEGFVEGRQLGLREGLLDGIELALAQKFGEAGQAILPEVRQLS